MSVVVKFKFLLIYVSNAFVIDFTNVIVEKADDLFKIGNNGH